MCVGEQSCTYKFHIEERQVIFNHCNGKHKYTAYVDCSFTNIYYVKSIPELFPHLSFRKRKHLANCNKYIFFLLSIRALN